MTYEKLFFLKFKMGFSTYELVQRYPSDIERVTDVALMDVPEGALKKIVTEKKDWSRLARLRKRFADYL